MEVVQIRGLSVDYGKYPVIRDFSLSVEEGAAVLIKGPSGCGKSTLLHAICGLIPGSIKANIKGEILVSGRKVHDMQAVDKAKEIGIVFQNPETQLFCDSVEDEIAFGLENVCTPIDEIAARINEVLALVGMDEYRYASPKELSGGQKQRVVLAAVLALDPKLLLLDEALSQMDITGREALITYLKKLREQGRTMIMVDHDDYLAEIASSVLEMNNIWEVSQ